MDWSFMFVSFPQILEAAPIALLISVCSLLAGAVLGFILALFRIYKVPFFNRFAGLYISFNRGTPLLVNLYLVYFTLPYAVYTIGTKMGLHVSINSINPLFLAIAAFSFNSAAYISEIIRSALLSVDAGQIEASYSVGLTHMQALKRIVIPQAMVVAMPNMSNLYISLFKSTSLAYTVTIVEILGRAKVLAAEGYTYLEAYIDVAIIYWVICIIFENVFYFVEKRLKRFRAEISI